MRVIVTRPVLQALPWVARLQALGVDAAPLPLIGIAPALDAAPLMMAWAELAGRALVMFVSANAVAHFFAHRPAGTGWPAGVLAGSTGPGTSAALQGAGVANALIAEPAADAAAFDSEALWAQLAGCDWAGRRVLVVRGEDGRDWLADTLRQRGAMVDFVTAYRRSAPTLDGPGQALLAAALDQPAAHVWHFSSSEAVAHLRTLAAAADWRGSRALASHPRIAEAALALGFGRVDVVAPRPEAVAMAVANSVANSVDMPAAMPVQVPSIQSGRP